MGPLYYAGTADQIKWCTEEVKELLPPDLMRHVQEDCNIQPNPTAGSPELSKSWNECKHAIKLLAQQYRNAQDDLK